MINSTFTISSFYTPFQLEGLTVNQKKTAENFVTVMRSAYLDKVSITTSLFKSLKTTRATLLVSIPQTWIQWSEDDSKEVAIVLPMELRAY